MFRVPSVDQVIKAFQELGDVFAKLAGIITAVMFAVYVAVEGAPEYGTVVLVPVLGYIYKHIKGGEKL